MGSYSSVDIFEFSSQLIEKSLEFQSTTSGSIRVQRAIEAALRTTLYSYGRDQMLRESEDSQIRVAIGGSDVDYAPHAENAIRLWRRVESRYGGHTLVLEILLDGVKGGFIDLVKRQLLRDLEDRAFNLYYPDDLPRIEGIFVEDVEPILVKVRELFKQEQLSELEAALDQAVELAFGAFASDTFQEVLSNVC